METFIGIRRLDRLGRVTIPVSTRRSLNMKEHQVVVGNIEDGSYVIRKAKEDEKGNKIDKLGRITISSFARELLDLGYSDPLKVVIRDKSIILSKFNKTCIICHEQKDIIEYKGKGICLNCIKEMNEKVIY